MFSPFFVLFGGGVVLGTALAASASSWIISWVGLELNFLSFLPIIFMGELMGSNESGVKYFFSQSLASFLLLVGALFPLFVNVWGSVFLVVVALSMKLGAAPFHFWFPSVIEGMGWLVCLILLTWQSLAPLLLISGFGLIGVVVICSALVGCLGGFNQTSLKKILVYSSIMHIGWMLSGVGLSLSLGLSYYMVYSFFSVVLVGVFSWWGILRLGGLFISFFFVSVSILLFLLSMGGFPPMLGFFPSWNVIVELLSMDLFLSFFLVFSSLVNLFFYFRLFYGSLFGEGPIFHLVLVSGEGVVFLGFCLMISLFGGGFYSFFFL